jgi:enoyl-CoA hydratase/carnithine racemase
MSPNPSDAASAPAVGGTRLSALRTPLPSTKYCTLQLILPHVLLVTLNRPDKYNALHIPAHRELDAVWTYLEGEPELWCAILTGAGEKAFCAGADLKGAFEARGEGSDDHAGNIHAYPPSGFGGLSRRYHGIGKPIIAVVNGITFGGGVEIVLACDIVIAVEKATFSLPEVKRGVMAANGGLARLVRTVGRAI